MHGRGRSIFALVLAASLGAAPARAAPRLAAVDEPASALDIDRALQLIEAGHYWEGAQICKRLLESTNESPGESETRQAYLLSAVSALLVGYQEKPEEREAYLALAATLHENYLRQWHEVYGAGESVDEAVAALGEQISFTRESAAHQGETPTQARVRQLADRYREGQRKLDEGDAMAAVRVWTGVIQNDTSLSPAEREPFVVAAVRVLLELNRERPQPHLLRRAKVLLDTYEIDEEGTDEREGLGVELDRGWARLQPQPTNAPTSAEEPPARVVVHKPARRSKLRRDGIVWTSSGSVGLALGAASVAFGSVFMPHARRAVSQSELDAATSRAYLVRERTKAIVYFSVGGALLAGGAATLAIGIVKLRKSNSKRASARLVPTFGPRSLGMLAKVRF